MSPVDNYPQASDWVNMRDNFLASLGYVGRTVLFRKFKNYSTQGSGLESHRITVYNERTETIYLSNVRVFDTVEGGYFTTGDLDVATSFQIRGYSPAYTLPDNTVISEYAGDEIIWNGRVWVPADQIEPKPFGPRSGIVYWRSVLRVTDRSAQGLTPGPT